MTKPDVTIRTERRAGGTVTRARALLAMHNPVPGDAFSDSWHEPHWQEELGRILATPGPEDTCARRPARPRRPRRPRRHWRLAGLTAIGVAGATAAVTVLAVPGPPRATPSHGPALSVFRWPSGLAGTNPGGSGAARNVLLAVADTVAHQPAPTMGAYWRADTEYGDFVPVGSALSGGRYTILERGRESDWYARGDFKTSSVIGRWLGVQLASPADAAAWRRAGRPTTWGTPADFGSADPQGFTGGFGGPTRAAPGKPIAEFSGTGPSSLTYNGKPLSDLPPDPAVLRKLLGQDYQREGAIGSISAWLFSSAPALLTDPVSPAVRSAVYRVLAALPGAVNLGTVRDINGRSGTGIALQARYSRCLVGTGAWNQAGSPPTAPCTVQQRLIINPSTGLPLAFELRYVSPPGGVHWRVRGGLFSYEIFRGAGWTNQAPPAH
jgi:hypothetical protein